MSPSSSFLFFDTVLWTEIIMIILLDAVEYQFTKEIPHSEHLSNEFHIVCCILVHVSKPLYCIIQTEPFMKWSDFFSSFECSILTHSRWKIMHLLNINVQSDTQTEWSDFDRIENERKNERTNEWNVCFD